MGGKGPRKTYRLPNLHALLGEFFFPGGRIRIMSESNTGGFHRPVQKLVDSFIGFPRPSQGEIRCKRILPPLPYEKGTPPKAGCLFHTVTGAACANVRRVMRPTSGASSPQAPDCLAFSQAQKLAPFAARPLRARPAPLGSCAVFSGRKTGGSA